MTPRNYRLHNCFRCVFDGTEWRNSEKSLGNERNYGGAVSF